MCYSNPSLFGIHIHIPTLVSKYPDNERFPGTTLESCERREINGMVNIYNGHTQRLLSLFKINRL